MTRTRLLIVHPESSGLAMLASMLRPLGHELIDATSDGIARRMLLSRPRLVLIGGDPSGPEALELLSYIRHKYPRTPVILLFTKTDAERINQALRFGAAAVLRFPLPAGQLQAAVVQALEAPAAHQDPRDEPSVAPTAPHDRPTTLPQRRPERIEHPGPCSCPCPSQPVEPGIGEATDAGRPIRSLKESLEGPEREFILQALRAYGWNRHDTAMALDISRSTLYHKMKKYGLLVQQGD